METLMATVTDPTIARAELDVATAQTSAVAADPASTFLDRHAAAWVEMEAFDAYWRTGPEAEAELEAGI
jgi:hypothetical protein